MAAPLNMSAREEVVRRVDDLAEALVHGCSRADIDVGRAEILRALDRFGVACGSATSHEATLLRVRSLIADKEMLVAQANLDLSRGGGCFDWAAACVRIDAEIEKLLSTP